MPVARAEEDQSPRGPFSPKTPEFHKNDDSTAQPVMLDAAVQVDFDVGDAHSEVGSQFYFLHMLSPILNPRNLVFTDPVGKPYPTTIVDAGQCFCGLHCSYQEFLLSSCTCMVCFFLWIYLYVVFIKPYLRRRHWKLVARELKI